MIKNSIKEWVDKLPENKGFLTKSQEKAKKQLNQYGLPSKTSEEWKFTDIKKLKHMLSMPINDLQENISFARMPETASNSFRVQLDFSIEEIKQSALPKGISLLDSKEIESLAKKIYANSSSSWTMAINQASSSYILGIKVSAENKHSLEVIVPTIKSQLTSTRVLILLEKNAKLDLLEIISGENNAAQSHLTEIYLEENARINHGLIAIGNDSLSLLAKPSILQDKNSDYSLHFMQEGWGLSRIEPSIKQLKGLAKSRLNGLQISRDDQQLSTHTYVKFNGPGGSLEQLQKAIAFNSSHSIFHGVIDVPKVAQKTKASQLSKNLLLSEKAEINTKPELKIIADDVSCTHGATISQLEEEELFYINSRGINRNDASLLILAGYAKEIVQNIPLQPKRWAFLNNLLAI
ncbi:MULTISPECIES: Fe-S cluster assembly protein SufD [Prochlorococcus]|uniref:Fe-S cluster assembly protein SufD n=1 Tax=Prochlorococcus TaxID=1218 RepID=UPI00053384DD|nr:MULTISPECIES: Fe-S cluster assembly protein SufD [Prochlorococcus]KGG13311.1 Iron-sulfur cluster assembly protein SufD [Prochlorococcus sp. MIT 0601]